MHEHGETFMVEFMELLGSQAHWGFEFTTSAVQGAIMYPVIRFVAKRWVARHDRENH